jgi:uncharacterized membrane protein HdeD (DUF308 family)
MTPSILLPLSGLLAKNWWVLLLRGIVAILFGILAFSHPLITMAGLILLFGIYALVDGGFSVIGALTGWRHREDRWLLLLEGLVGLWVGFITLKTPAITAVGLIFFIAIWALATGVLKIVGAIRLRREVPGEFWLALSGIASVMFACLVMLRPAAGALGMIWLIGWFAVLGGASLVVLSFKMRSLRGRRFAEPTVTDTRQPRAA